MPLLTCLRPHPVSRNDNLRKIALSLDLNPPMDFSKTQLLTVIERHLNTNPDLEQKVQDMAHTIMSEYKQCKTDSIITDSVNSVL